MSANTILGLGPEIRRKLTQVTVDDPGQAAVAVLRVAANVADTETVTIGSDVYEFDRAANGVTAGRIAVTGHADDTPANATNALISTINASGTENVKAIDISDNEVLIATADSPGGDIAASDSTLALAETMAGVNNAWDTAALRAGEAESDTHQLAVASRVPNAAEVALGNLHVVVPFTVTEAFVRVRTTASGATVAWDGAITVSGNRVTVNNAGVTDWATTDTVNVVVFG